MYDWRNRASYDRSASPDDYEDMRNGSPDPLLSVGLGCAGGGGTSWAVMLGSPGATITSRSASPPIYPEALFSRSPAYAKEGEWGVCAVQEERNWSRTVASAVAEACDPLSESEDQDQGSACDDSMDSGSSKGSPPRRASRSATPTPPPTPSHHLDGPSYSANRGSGKDARQALSMCESDDAAGTPERAVSVASTNSFSAGLDSSWRRPIARRFASAAESPASFVSQAASSPGSNTTPPPAAHTLPSSAPAFGGGKGAGYLQPSLGALSAASTVSAPTSIRASPGPPALFAPDTPHQRPPSAFDALASTSSARSAAWRVVAASPLAQDKDGLLSREPHSSGASAPGEDYPGPDRAPDLTPQLVGQLFNDPCPPGGGAALLASPGPARATGAPAGAKQARRRGGDGVLAALAAVAAMLAVCAAVSAVASARTDSAGWAASPGSLSAAFTALGAEAKQQWATGGGWAALDQLGRRLPLYSWRLAGPVPGAALLRDALPAAWQQALDKAGEMRGASPLRWLKGLFSDVTFHGAHEGKADARGAPPAVLGPPQEAPGRGALSLHADAPGADKTSAPPPPPSY